MRTGKFTKVILGSTCRRHKKIGALLQMNNRNKLFSIPLTQ